MTPQNIMITKNSKGKYMLQYLIDEESSELTIRTTSKKILLEVIEEFNKKNPEVAIKVKDANKR